MLALSAERINPGSQWLCRVIALVESMPAGTINAMGIPVDWQTLPLWANARVALANEPVLIGQARYEQRTRCRLHGRIGIREHHELPRQHNVLRLFWEKLTVDIALARISSHFPSGTRTSA